MSKASQFHMPDVGEGIAEAEIIEWLVTEGDLVTEDQPIVVVETDKSQVELPSPFAGEVREIHSKAGDIVPVGHILVTVGGERTITDARSPHAAVAAVMSAHPGPAASTANAEPVSTVEVPRPLRPLASPSTRRLATRLGIELAQVIGTGPRGRIQATDVRDFADNENRGPVGTAVTAESRASAPATTGAARPHQKPRHETTVVPVRGLRRQIAKAMTESLQIPHVTEFREIDATELLSARASLKPYLEREGIKLSVLPFLVKATVRALTLHPSFNATFDAEREELTQYGSVDVGIATATPDGLIVPVLRNTESFGVRRLAVEIDRVAELARTRKARPDELGGAGFTVTNFGSFGTWLGTPVIRHPEVAIAGFGRITERVIPVDGAPAVRPVLPIVVATDHRINDGADLGAFVTEIAEALSQPYLLLE